MRVTCVSGPPPPKWNFLEGKDLTKNSQCTSQCLAPSQHGVNVDLMSK